MRWLLVFFVILVATLRVLSGYRASSLDWNSGYIVAAPPRVASDGSLFAAAKSLRNGFSPGR